MAWATAWALIVALFLVVAVQSPGFDDEVTNIDLIEHLGTLPTVRLMQQEDVHPPGSYLLNGLLHSALGSWPAVRAASACAYLLALFGFARFTRREHGELAAGLILLVAGLSPAALIWCTSIRWYAYLVPLLMWCLAVPRSRDGWWYHAKPAVAWLLMAHVGYAALVLLPVIWLWYGLHGREGWWQHARRSAPWWLLAGLLFAPQAMVFFTVHVHHTEGQTSGAFKSLAGIAISLFSNQGVFPASVPGGLSVLGWACLYALIGWAAWRKTMPSQAVSTFVAALICMVASGLAGKFRNLVVVLPFQAYLLAPASRLIAGKHVAALALLLVTATQLTGAANVLRHQDTTKNSWNLPTAEVLNTLQGMTHSCRQAPAIYTFDPVLSYNLKRAHPEWSVSNYFARFDKQAPTASDCVVVLHTYRGALSKPVHAALLAAEHALGDTAPLREVALGRDDHAGLKQRLDPDYPEYQVVIRLHQGQMDASALTAWVLSRS